MGSKRSQTVIFLVCCVVGIVFLVIGAVLIHVFDVLIHTKVKDNIPLKNGSDSYKNWQSPKSPIYFQVWMFDIVNYLEVIDGEKPLLIEKGPYTFREHRVKLDIQFHDNGTLFYKERQSFTFDRSLSVGSENDTFYSINIPMLTAINMVRNKSGLFKELMSAAIDVSKVTLFHRLSVYQLMWGYHDGLLAKLNKLGEIIPGYKPIPETFGLFAGKNNTDDGIYQIYSGIKDVSNFGKVITWNGLVKLDYWTTPIANAINGSDGTIYPPFFDMHSTRYLFSSDLCRSLGMDYVSSVTVRDIDLYHYMASGETFANETVNPDNEGFCTPKGNCLPSGLLNVSNCRQGAPVVMSMPHFLGCDSDIIHSVRGLNPNRAEHTSFIDVEPMTGVVMNAGKKLQINVFIEKVDKFPYTYNIVSHFLPVMWLNESAMISPSDASKFRSAVTDMIKLTDAVKYGLIAVGGFILIMLIAILIKVKCMNKANPDVILINDETFLSPKD